MSSTSEPKQHSEISEPVNLFKTDAHVEGAGLWFEDSGIPGIDIGWEVAYGPNGQRSAVYYLAADRGPYYEEYWKAPKLYVHWLHGRFDEAVYEVVGGALPDLAGAQAFAALLAHATDVGEETGPDEADGAEADSPSPDTTLDDGLPF